MSSARPVRPAASRIAAGTSEKWRPIVPNTAFVNRYGPSGVQAPSLNRSRGVAGAERLPDREGGCLAAAQSVLASPFGQDATHALPVEEIGAGVAGTRSDGDSVKRGHAYKSTLSAVQQSGVQELDPAGPDSLVRHLFGVRILEQLFEQRQDSFGGALGIAGTVTEGDAREGAATNQERILVGAATFLRPGGPRNIPVLH